MAAGARLSATRHRARGSWQSGGVTTDAHDHRHDEDTADLSRLLVQLLQVLLAFVLGQSIIQNRALLIEAQDRTAWIGLLALLGVLVYTVESWIDWHLDVAQHPFQVQPSNPRHRWAMGRLWLDFAHVVAVAYLAVTVAHVAFTPDASLVRHLIGYGVAHALMLVSTMVRDRTYGRHGRLRIVEAQDLLAALVVIIGYAAVAQGTGNRELLNAVTLVMMMLVSVVHHARLRELRRSA